jgi:hypothetical protein
MKEWKYRAVVLILALIVTGQALFLLAGSPSARLAAGEDGKILPLQGKEAVAASAGPADPALLPVVPGMMPGEGRSQPRSPLSALPGDPLMPYIGRGMEPGFTLDSPPEAFRLLAVGVLLLEGDKSLALSAEQGERVLKALEIMRRVESRSAAARLEILDSLTPAQSAFLLKGTGGVEPGDAGPLLKGMLKARIAAWYKDPPPEWIEGRSLPPSPGKRQGERHYLFPWPVSRLAMGIKLLENDRALRLTHRQMAEIYSAIRSLVEAQGQVDEANALLAGLLSPAQKEYLSRCLSDRSFVERLEVSLGGDGREEPVLGISGSLFRACADTLSRRRDQAPEGGGQSYRRGEN